MKNNNRCNTLLEVLFAAMLTIGITSLLYFYINNDKQEWTNQAKNNIIGNKISCLWDNEINKNSIPNLHSWNGILPCQFWDKNIPYSRVLNWKNSWIEDLEKFFYHYNFEWIDQIFERLKKEVEWQYARLALKKEFWSNWIQSCDLEEWEWICKIFFDGWVWIWKYKFDTWDQENQWGRTSIMCELTKQSKFEKNDNEYTLLLNGWVQNCKVIYIESWLEYSVWDEFESEKDKEYTLRYIEEKINNFIMFLKYRENTWTFDFEGVIEKLEYSENKYISWDNNFTAINEIKDWNFDYKNIKIYFKNFSSNDTNFNEIIFVTKPIYWDLKVWDRVELKMLQETLNLLSLKQIR